MRHRNDIYGDHAQRDHGAVPAIPAATVVLLRETPGLEVLMLHKTSKVAFGGMWVFPGGRIDDADYPPDRDADGAARNAAARETLEETGLSARPEDFVWFSHWTPPPGPPKRFATWFFAAPVATSVADRAVAVDGGEIQDHRWLAPADALAEHAAGAIDLAPPTWVTLYQLSRYPGVAPLLARLRGIPARHYQTRIGKRADGVRVAMWHGDAGYRDGNADAPGERHRLVMRSGGFVFENTVEDY